ncbi:MAG TPA: VOC family protein [Planctomycetaceae bacterium]|nr:VOC family protein [Planctomycetaceae bacterium]
MKRIILGLTLWILACFVPPSSPAPLKADPKGHTAMRLGNFSISLAVKDLKASRDFYEKLGFRVVGGNGQNFSILQNDASTIGLFHGMFEKNILTFNPGWDRTGATLPDFDDVRDIQRTLASRGLKPATKADESSTGPASFVLFDPDGNQILVDQHEPRPRK